MSLRSSARERDAEASPSSGSVAAGAVLDGTGMDPPLVVRTAMPRAGGLSNKAPRPRARRLPTPAPAWYSAGGGKEARSSHGPEGDRSHPDPAARHLPLHADLHRGHGRDPRLLQ